MAIAFAYASGAEKATKTKKSPSTASSTTAAPAIIAIEIVDPNENKTSTKNSKRTIESALGYGFQAPQPPKYEVYKYSQHDIPPYKGSASQFSGFTAPSQGVPHALGTAHLSNSGSYPQAPGYTGHSLSQFYQPGTTLYSTLNSQGHLSGLSPNAPFQENHGNAPVIVLRVHPDQLAGISAGGLSGGGLFANLPQSHPLAHSLNSIDLQSLLSGYLQGQQGGQQQQAYPQAPGLHGHQGHSVGSGFDGGYSFPNHDYNNQFYQSSYPQYQPQYHQQPVDYQQYQYQYPSAGPVTYQQPASYQQPSTYDQPEQYPQSGKLQTYENFPDDKHTKVVFKGAPKSSVGTPSVSSSPAESYSKSDIKSSEGSSDYDYNSGPNTSAEEDSGYNYEKPGPAVSSESYVYSPELEAAKEFDAGGNMDISVSSFLPSRYISNDFITSASGYNNEYGDVPPVASDKSEHHNYHADSNKGARSKKSSNIKMRIPKSLKKSRGSNVRDKREKLD